MNTLLNEIFNEFGLQPFNSNLFRRRYITDDQQEMDSETRSGSSSFKSGRGNKRSNLMQPVVRAMTSETVAIAAQPKGLTYLANMIKGKGQMRGATVEIALAQMPDGRKILVGGINSGADWKPAQITELKRLGIAVAPQTLRNEKKPPHAEVNIATYLRNLKAIGIRWSRGAVGDPNDKGGNAGYVCQDCQNFIRNNRIGGEFE